MRNFFLKSGRGVVSLDRYERQRGSFLLEALLAVLILSVGLVGLIRGLLISLNAAKEMEAYSRAILIADNTLLEVIRLNGVKITAPVQVDLQSDQFKAQIDLVESDNIFVPGILREARVMTKWPGALKDKELHVTTLVFGSPDENE